MPRDPRTRVEEAESDLPFAPNEQLVPTEGEGAEQVAEFNKAMRDYAPEFVQPTARGNYLFSDEELIQHGMTDAEIIALQKEGAAAGFGGLREYDEDIEHQKLAQKREQQGRIAIIDSRDSVRLALSESERYFAGTAPNAGGKYVKRYPYVSPTNETVAINGYIFRIPKYVKVLLPTEVLAILAEAAQARQQYEVLSAIYTARQYRPIESTDPDTYHARIAQNHKVKHDLIPGGAFPGR